MVVDGLPATMKDLGPSNNQFIGEVSLESLPQRLQCLDIANNLLSERGDGRVASAGLRAQRRNIDPRSRRLAGHQRLAGGQHDLHWWV